MLTHTKELFIEKSVLVHGDRYDYSKVNYINNLIKIIIICRLHGKFEQVPSSHTSGHGCCKCASEKSRRDRSLSLKEFIQKANFVHKNKFNYSKVRYINHKEKVIIECSSHGEFIQKPNTHLSGKGCKKCRNEKLSLDRRLDVVNFINRSNLVHNNLYNYSKVKYINSNTKVIIECSSHGEFEQVPRSHLSGGGCPVCSASKGELFIKNILDKNNISYIKEYRIPEILARLHYDFYLPKYNTVIEFHGIQHYKYIPFFHRKGEDDFLKQKNRDDIVRDNAKMLGYRYLEFNYRQLKLPLRKFEKFILEKIYKIK